MKQAVVLIHGIGEQKPMSTVRGFVKAILGEVGEHRPAYWNKPDRISELFELRRLQSRGRTSTHFFEYYWAYNLTGTNVWDLLGWLFGLVIRPGKDMSRLGQITLAGQPNPAHCFCRDSVAGLRGHLVQLAHQPFHHRNCVVLIDWLLIGRSIRIRLLPGRCRSVP